MLLRGAAGHAERGRLYVPEDLLRAHGARSRALLLGPDPDWLHGDEESDVEELHGSVGFDAELEARRRRRRQQPMTEADRAAARSAVKVLAERMQAHMFAVAALSRGEWPVLPHGALSMADLYEHEREAEYLKNCVESSGPLPLSASLISLAFLPGVRCAAYFSALERVGFDLHHPYMWPSYPAPSAASSLLGVEGALGFRLRMLASSFGFISPLK